MRYDKATAVATATRKALKTHIKTSGADAVARGAGVSVRTLQRALAGEKLAAATVAALSRVAPRVRTADEFSSQPLNVMAPRRQQGGTSWSLERIRSARDAQLRGEFALPVQLAEMLGTDDALFTSRAARLAPQNAVASRLVPHPSTRGEAIAKLAAVSIVTPRPVIAGLHATLVDHGVAIGHVLREANADGTRVDMCLEEWPLEHVKWNTSRETLETRTRDGGAVVDVRHGNGEWIVFRKFAILPWVRGSCLLPACFVWASHAEGLGDWNATTHTHGLAKIMGELPLGIDLCDADGVITPTAKAFLEMLRDIASGDVVAGIQPHDSKTNFLANGSNAWQIFLELIQNREKAAARIYTGTDAILGSVGGAPGVDIAQLFGVATTLIQGDLTAIESGLNSGLHEPWTALNFGDSRLSPRHEYQLPDPDEDQKRKQRADNYDRLMATLERMRAQKLEVTQETVNRLAVDFGVEPAPTLAAPDQQTATLVLAPTDVAKVVRVREARAAQGLPPFDDARDDLTIGELDALAAAKATPPAAAAPAAPGAAS